LALLLAAACATPQVQEPLSMTRTVTPGLLVDENTFVSFDGAKLGLTYWEGQGYGPATGHVIVGLHGMNDYANAFHMAAPYWASQGVSVYAYDQRGFGRSPGRGIWPDEELMREDLRTAVDLARTRHPDAKVTVVGISMGAAVAMSAFGSDRPPAADQFIASGPGLRGWGAMNLTYRTSLWLSAHIRPGWIVKPPRRFVRIEPSDNVEMLQRTWSDPLMMPTNRIDQVYGLVSLMERAHQRAPNLPQSLPTLVSYGANDYVVPMKGVERTAKVLPSHIRTVYYEKGFHMLLRDLQAQTVHDDYLAFMLDPTGELPSGAVEWPFR
jgi:alpha-beta hydrolase superfamily lysophospholipase